MSLQLLSDVLMQRHRRRRGHNGFTSISSRNYSIKSFTIYLLSNQVLTRKPSYRWQTRATRKPAKIAPIRRAYNVVADNTGVHLHAFNCYCVRNPRNPEKFTENSNLWSSRSFKVIDIGVNRKPICDLLLVIDSNVSCICYRFRDIHG